MDMHSRTGPRLDPTKPKVREVVGRSNIEFVDPSVGEQPDDNEDAYQAESNAEDGERSGVDAKPGCGQDASPDGGSRPCHPVKNAGEISEIQRCYWKQQEGVRPSGIHLVL